MKKIWNRWKRLLTALALVSAVSMTTTMAQGNISLQVFYDELQPYGTWMAHNEYGYVWIPRADQSFTPYATNGYWINTEYGNTWVSDYSWGWAPFHYGRWAFDDFYGWIWVPDTEWAPAWVAWRSGDGYYGWAPLTPGFHMHMAVNYYDRIPHHHWNFVPYRYVTYRNVYTHCVQRPLVINIYNHTTIVTHHYVDNQRRTYFSGPSRNEIERTSRSRVEVYKINDRIRPGRTEVGRNAADFYRPDIDNSHDSRSRAVPSNYVRRSRSGNMEQVETGRERNTIPNASRNTEDFKNNVHRGQRTSINENPEQERRQYNATRDAERREFDQSQRMPPSEQKSNVRTYEPVQRENQNSVRDQYEAPAINRTPANTEMRRRTVPSFSEPAQNSSMDQRQSRPAQAQPELQTERQTPIRQSGSFPRERNTSSSSDRSQNVEQTRTQQSRTRNFDQSSQEPAHQNSGSRSAGSRRRN